MVPEKKKEIFFDANRSMIFLQLSEKQISERHKANV